MENNKIALTLDTNAHLVSAVLRFAKSGSPGDLGSAVNELSDCERRHGVVLLREEGGDIPDHLLVKSGERLLNAKEIRELIHAHPQDQLTYLDSGLIDQKDSLCRQHLFPFISDSGFLIKGMDFTNDSYILFPGGHLYTWSRREWGKTMADWLQWHTNSSEPASYVDFAFSFGTGETNYEAWCTAVLKVIEEKWLLAVSAP